MEQMYLPEKTLLTFELDKVTPNDLEGDGFT